MEESTRVLSNGLEVILLPNHSLPIVRVKGWIKAGPALASSTWLGKLVSQMLENGTRNYTKKEFGDALDERALEYDVEPSTTSNFFVEWKGTLIRAYLSELLELAGESLIFPSFPDEELGKLKKRMEAAMRSNESDPEFRAENEVMRMLYGPSHPNYSLPTEEAIVQIRGMRGEDILHFWEERYLPNTSGLVVVGDFDAEVAFVAVQEVFSQWSVREDTQDPVEEDKDHINDFGAEEGYDERTVYLPDKANAVLWIGQRIPISATHTDYPALCTAVNAFGGSFHSRFVQHVREKLGLSYYLRALLDDMNTIPGHFSVFAHTNPDNMQRTHEETWFLLGEFCKNGITQEELDQEKATVSGKLAFGRLSLKGIAKEVVTDKIIGMTRQELEKKILALDLDEVNQAVREYLDPSRMKVVRAGTL